MFDSSVWNEYLCPEPIKWTRGYGWVNVYLFFIQGVSGILLLLYYRPTIAQAYESVQQITNTLNYGWLIRGIHIWAVHLLIISIFLHIIYVLINRSYIGVPVAVWLSGSIMMAFIGLEAATGYLLPWTQNSYWATTFVTQLPSSIPVLGEFIKIMIRGGSDISQITLSRFFALHILIIPLFFSLGGVFHIFTIKKFLIPKDLLAQILIFLVLMAILFSLSTFFPPRVYLKANPFQTLLNIKPEWYFLASYEIFQLFHALHFGGHGGSMIIGIFIQVGIYIFFFFFPFLTPISHRNCHTSLTLAISSMFIFFALTILGYVR